MDSDRALGVANRRPRLHDVAERAGVSLGTVSNVLNNPHKVAPATRSRVFTAIDDLGFSPNGIASALARGDTRTVGLVVIDLSNSLFVDIARSVQHGAVRRGLYLQLSTSENDYDLQDRQMRVMNESRVRGLLVAPLDDPSAGIVRSRQLDCPVVVLNYDTADPDICHVATDNTRAGYLAADHLLALGRRRIALVGGHEQWQPVARRFEGARSAINDVRGARVLHYRTETVEAEEGARVGEVLARLNPHERPDAVLAVTDVMAAAVVTRLLAAGLRVPEDVAVMGCDHNSAAWGGPVPLSSMTMEGERMGAEGLRLLAEELDAPQQHVHQHVLLEPTLVIRESTIGRQPR